LGDLVCRDTCVPLVKLGLSDGEELGCDEGAVDSEGEDEGIELGFDETVDSEGIPEGFPLGWRLIDGYR
jgi:hypothetical protein